MALSPFLRDKWETNPVICFTCCKVTPKIKRLLSNSCSSLNNLTHYYIIPTGCVPDNTWLPSTLVSFSVSFCLFFSNCTQLQTFSTVFLTTLNTLHCLMAATFGPVADSLSFLLAKIDRLSFICATAHLMCAT